MKKEIASVSLFIPGFAGAFALGFKFPFVHSVMAGLLVLAVSAVAISAAVDVIRGPRA